MTLTQKTPVASPLNLPLLKSESTDEYLGLLERLTTEIKPKGIVEQFYVEDMASLIFEIRRLQRCKVSLINNAELEALKIYLNSWCPNQHSHSWLMKRLMRWRVTGSSKSRQSKKCSRSCNHSVSMPPRLKPKRSGSNRPILNHSTGCSH